MLQTTESGFCARTLQLLATPRTRAGNLYTLTHVGILCTVPPHLLCVLLLVADHVPPGATSRCYTLAHVEIGQLKKGALKGRL